ncbi:hypothetical protein FQN50_007247 [Emmonsiellopsis sp. PD_5]|nr:hypothetical protein FQN50_007247 [Emmonsiellopsis sp. PD_5]
MKTTIITLRTFDGNLTIDTATGGEGRVKEISNCNMYKIVERDSEEDANHTGGAIFYMARSHEYLDRKVGLAATSLDSLNAEITPVTKTLVWHSDLGHVHIGNIIAMSKNLKSGGQISGPKLDSFAKSALRPA